MTRIASFTLTNSTDIPSADPVICGVPLPQGKVTEGAKIKLVAGNSKALSAQAEVTARWADGSAKWAMVTVPKLSLKPNQKSKIDLITGRPSGKKSISIRRHAKGLSVNTGKLRFTISNKGCLVPRFDVCVKGGWQQRGVELDLAMTVECSG
ncbi:MAG: hypothetical protein HRT89_17905, partial [Lentisphaeria bacterium]|nr:hypothetical protein [Lentisphaeria bacterium]